MRKAGTQKLSIRRRMSLYNHVANKDEILDGIVDTIVGEITVPQTRSTAGKAMRGRAISATSVLLSTLGGTMLIVSRQPTSVRHVRYVDAQSVVLGRWISYAGPTCVECDRQLRVTRFTLQKLTSRSTQDEYADRAKDLSAMIARQTSTHTLHA